MTSPSNCKSFKLINGMTTEREHIRNQIIRRWNHLKNIDIDTITADFYEEKWFSQEEYESYIEKSGKMSRAKKHRFILTLVIQNIDKPSDLETFWRVIKKHACWYFEIQSVVQPVVLLNDANFGQHRLSLKEYRKVLEKEILPKLHVDDFLQQFIFDLDQHEEIWCFEDVRRKMAVKFVEAVLQTVEKGSFKFLVHILKNSERNGYKKLEKLLDKENEEGFNTDDREIVRNKIIGRWKTLKKQIHPEMLSETFFSKGLMTLEDLDTYNTKAKVMASGEMMDFILTTVVRNIENDRDFQIFVDVLKEKNALIEMDQPFQLPDWSINCCDTEHYKNQLTAIRTLLEKEILPMKHVDDFLENIVFDLDQHEDLLNFPKTKKEKSHMFVGAVLDKLENGSYQYLMHTLTLSKTSGYRRIVNELQQSSWKVPPTEPYRSRTRVSLTEKFYIACDIDADEIDPNVPLRMTIEFPPEIGANECFVEGIKEKILTKMLGCGFNITGVKEGSIIIFIEPSSIACIRNFKKSINRGELISAFKKVFEKDEVRDKLSCGEYTIDVTLTEDKLSLGEISDSVMSIPYCLVESATDYTNISNASRHFLIEEIEPLLLVNSFPDNCIAFRNINFRDIKDKQKRAEAFLDIIESEQCFDLLLEVIERKEMHYVLKMIKLWQQTRGLDVSKLRQKLARVASTITEETDLDSVVDVFRARSMLDEDKFCELIDRCAHNGNLELLEFMMDVFKAKPEHILTLVDALIINHLDKIVSDVLDLSEVDPGSGGGDYSVKCDESLPAGVMFKGKIKVIVTDNQDDVTNDSRTVYGINQSDINVSTNSTCEEITQPLIKEQDNNDTTFHDVAHVDSSTNMDSQLVHNEFDKDGTGKEHKAMRSDDPILKKTDNRDFQYSVHEKEKDNSVTASIAGGMGDDNFEKITTDYVAEQDHKYQDMMSPSWKCKSLQSPITLPSITIHTLDGSERTVAARVINARGAQLGIYGNSDGAINEQTEILSFEDGKSYDEPRDTERNSMIDVLENESSQFISSVESSVTEVKAKTPIRQIISEGSNTVSDQIKATESQKIPTITIKALDGTVRKVEGAGRDKSSLGKCSQNRKQEGPTDAYQGSSSQMTLAPAYGVYTEVMNEAKWRRKYTREAIKGSELSLEELEMVCAPDTVLLLDISGSIKDSAYADLCNFVLDFLERRNATRNDTGVQENIGIVTFGHRTEVVQHLTCDYGLVRQKLDHLPKPGGPSPLVGGLLMCKAVIDARGKISITQTSKGSLKLHPRIILVSDGNLSSLDCVIGDLNIDDLNSESMKDQDKSIFKLYELCKEFKEGNIKILCVPIGCFNEELLKTISDVTDGRLVQKEEAPKLLGKEYMKMKFAMKIHEDERHEHTLKQKLLSYSSLTPADYDEIIDIAKNQIPFLVDEEEDEREGQLDSDISDFFAFLLQAADEDVLAMLDTEDEDES